MTIAQVKRRRKQMANDERFRKALMKKGTPIKTKVKKK